ncbi:MAG: hypothetical protein K0Q97_2792 [Bacillota bacterium]|jgi:hypothetical protein|nr:hypothetical protein [Bacillota bacterium]
MKGLKNLNKAVVILLAFTMSMFLFAGCQGKSATSSQNSTQNSAGGKKFDKNATKQNYQNKLQALVKDSTITQDQSNKILDKLTTNMNNDGRGGRRQNNSGNQQNNAQQNANGNNQTSRPRNNPLSGLVSNKVITQDQADKVMNALRPNRQNQNNTTTSQNSTNQ